MSDTFSEFVNFISDDPLMLALCIAIVVLIIIFILVLCLGGRKKVKEEEPVETVTENTTSLLKSDINEEPLRSTQEFTLSMNDVSETELEKTKNVPDLEAVASDLSEKDAPISIDEAISLKSAREENEIKDTIEIPVIDSSSPSPVEIKPKEEPVPSVSEPVSEPILLEMNEDSEPELPTIKMDTSSTESSTSAANLDKSQPFSSVYLGGEARPSTEPVDYNKTGIIRHIPDTNESEFPEPVSDKPAAASDDIDLPKLNSNSNTSVLNTLTGESFNIK